MSETLTPRAPAAQRGEASDSRGAPAKPERFLIRKAAVLKQTVVEERTIAQRLWHSLPIWVTSRSAEPSKSLLPTGHIVDEFEGVKVTCIDNGMPVVVGPGESSGRHRYNAPPEAELALARQQVEARVAGEWPQLRAALRIAAVPQQGSR